MEAVILIHGITGSALSQQQGSDLVSIWPPDTSDLFGYSQAKFDILLDKPLTVTGIIDTAMDGCVQVYAPIEADLQDICTNHLNASMTYSAMIGAKMPSRPRVSWLLG